MMENDHIVIDIHSYNFKQKVQEDFVKVFKDFSDVINDNVLIIGEKFLYKYKKTHNDYISKLNRQKNVDIKIVNATEQDPPWKQHEEFRYMVNKVESIQTQLEEHLRVLDYYYIHHKWWYDVISTVIIFISSGMSFFEAVSMSFNFGRYQKVGTVFISTSIAALTSILKFKNYKEKAEEIVRIKEKVLASQSKLYLFEKDLKSKLYLYKSNDEPPPPNK